MPTEPHRALLDRDVSKAANASALSAASYVLTEIVNYGTQLLARGNQGADEAYARLAQTDSHLPNPPVGDFHLPLLLLYLHALELTDAIQVLVAEAVITPAELQTRALFEVVIQLEWLFKADTARRAFAYQFFDLKSRIRYYRSFIPSTPEGKQLAAAHKADAWVSGMTLREIGDPAAAIQNLEGLFVKPGYQDAVAEYDRMRNAKKKPPANWFSMYDGPGNIQELSRAVGRAMQYEIVYRHWSASVHGTYVGQRVTRNGGIRAMRQASALPAILPHVSTLALTAIQLYGDFYRPGEQEERARWYMREIKPRLIRAEQEDLTPGAT
jgi:hypothetical protein